MKINSLRPVGQYQIVPYTSLVPEGNGRMMQKLDEDIIFFPQN